MTHIILRNSLDCEIARVSLDDEDATTGAIARAAIDIIESTGSLHAGDSIVVIED